MCGKLFPITNRRRKCPMRICQPEFDLVFSTGHSDGFIPRIVKTVVSIDVLFERVDRPVRRSIGEIKKERLLILLACVIGHVFHGVIGERIREVKPLRLVFGISVPRETFVVALKILGVEIMRTSRDYAVVMIKSALQRPVVFFAVVFRVEREMPFADSVCAVTRRTQHLCNRHATIVQFALITSVATIRCHVPNACLMRIQTRHQRRSRGAATTGIVKLREAKPLARELVEIRRADFAAVTTQITPTHVIRKDNDDVGPRCPRSLAASANDKSDAQCKTGSCDKIHFDGG